MAATFTPEKRGACFIRVEIEDHTHDVEVYGWMVYNDTIYPVIFLDGRPVCLNPSDEYQFVRRGPE